MQIYEAVCKCLPIIKANIPQNSRLPRSPSSDDSIVRVGGHMGRVLQALDVLQADRPTFRGVRKVEGAVRQAQNAERGFGSIRLPEPD